MTQDKKSWLSRLRSGEKSSSSILDMMEENASDSASKTGAPKTTPIKKPNLAKNLNLAKNPNLGHVENGANIQSPDKTIAVPEALDPYETIIKSTTTERASKSVSPPISALSPDIAPSPIKAEPKKNWFIRMRESLRRSTKAISEGISNIFTKAKLDDQTLEDLEDLLITTDLGVNVASRLTAGLAKDRFDKEITGDEVKKYLALEIETILKPIAKPLAINPLNKPHVILMAGVNGAGKTTTIGKLANQYIKDGKKVMLAAGDTFRAAAVEQLAIWGDRVGAPVVKKEIGSDAAALAYEAVDRAVAEHMDILLIDTAGRLQNRDELMQELAKVIRVIGKKLNGAPHDTVLVLDATTGQNAVHQVEVFQKMAQISGLIMTKLDGSARGGVLVACADKFGLPVHAIGIGEGLADMQPFNARDFARALVGLIDE